MFNKDGGISSKERDDLKAEIENYKRKNEELKESNDLKIKELKDENEELKNKSTEACAKLSSEAEKLLKKCQDDGKALLKILGKVPGNLDDFTKDLKAVGTK